MEDVFPYISLFERLVSIFGPTLTGVLIIAFIYLRYLRGSKIEPGLKHDEMCRARLLSCNNRFSRVEEKAKMLDDGVKETDDCISKLESLVRRMDKRILALLIKSGVDMREFGDNL